MSEHAPDSAPAASVCSGLHAHAGILVCVTEPLSYLARHKPLAALPPGGSSPIKRAEQLGSSHWGREEQGGPWMSSASSSW